MSLVISDEMLASALDRAIGQVLTPETIEARVQREIERRTSTISIEEAARSQGWEFVPFRRLLRRKGVQIVALSSRKPRIRVSDLEKLIQDHLRPVHTRRRRTNKL